MQPYQIFGIYDQFDGTVCFYHIFGNNCNVMIKDILVHMPVAITVMLSSNLIVNPIRKGRV